MKRALKYVFQLLLFIGLISSLALPADARGNSHAKGKEIPLKVMSFNIAHGRGQDGVVDLQRTAEVIRTSGADIIGLQEVDKHWSSRSNFVDQAKWLAEDLGMHYVYGANLDLEPTEEGNPRRQYGNAILSKYPILHYENHHLTTVFVSGANNEQRGLLEAVINVKGNHLRFFSTHLGLKDEERLISAEEMIDIVDASQKNSIIVGDMNARANFPEMERLTERFHDVFAEKGMDETFTFPAPWIDPETGETIKTPSSRIDFILADKNIEIENAEVVTTSVSDHLPIVSTFIIKKEKPFYNGQGK